MALEGRNTVESIRVNCPSKSTSASSSSSSPPRPQNCFGVPSMDCRSSEFMLQNNCNFKRSAAPVRFMYFNPDGSWVDFPSEVLGSLKSAFVEGKPMVDLLISGSRYLFDFLRMLQTDFESGFQRSIAWIDEKGKCFFPKTFVGEDFDGRLEKSENPKIEIEIRIDNNPIKRKRDGLVKEEPEVSSSMQQQQEDASKRQRLHLPDAETSRWPNARLLTEGEKAYSTVRDHFLPGIRKVDHGATITAIYQFTRNGHLEKARYEVFQKQIEITKAARGVSNTVYAWHGASAKGVESILAHGFAVPGKVSGPECYGVGVYLSPLGLPYMSAKLSEMDGNGEKHLILCRVILGNVEKVEVGSQQYYPSKLEFDTGADDLNNPKWYIVWSSNMNRHIIPEFVVSYKSSRQVQGQVKGPTCVKYSLENLFWKMRNLLPRTKIREVVTLYDTYREDLDSKIFDTLAVGSVISIGGHYC
ncbi:probable inactive poly [ADP-ribose] polymerase SRO1 isoform X2 [Manihot esculenta]|uniref:probable inactive poly [ADP-ribose] polymerase SRO1 isoform X2 n=1 Tax=Manihot esculenta TaxID=3983 RepID=UPI001CC49659|nr:probable inactive poly [ADP-ribose] polymerase SRO1 isoform X2 [Manihot esculenta]